MAFFSDLVSRIGRSFSKDYYPVDNGGYANSITWMNGSVREPFAGAWQAGLRDAADAGPNLYAHSAVYACINIISSDISRMEIQVLRKRPDGSREEHTNHPATRLFHSPNPIQTPLQFIQQYITSKLMFGNTYVLLLRDARGVVNEMYVLDPRKVQPLVTEKGDVFYKLGRDYLTGTDQDQFLPSSDLLHDRTVTLWHPLVGVTPMFAAMVPAQVGSRIQLNAERFFANMSLPGGFLQAPGKIDEKVARRLQSEWEQNYSKKGMGKVAVLTNGLDFKALTMKAVDAEMAVLLKMSTEEVARAFRVPLTKLGDPSKMNYRNNEQAERDYFNNALHHYVEAAEQCFEKALALSSDVEIEFDASSLFRMDTEARYTAHQSALNAGWKSINEVRAEEDLPPVKGGEEPRTQMQYVPVSQVDALNAANAAKGSGNEMPSPAPAEPAKELTEAELQSFVETFLARFSLGAGNGV